MPLILPLTKGHLPNEDIIIWLKECPYQRGTTQGLLYMYGTAVFPPGWANHACVSSNMVDDDQEEFVKSKLEERPIYLAKKNVPL